MLEVFIVDCCREVTFPVVMLQGLDILSKEPKGNDSIDLVSLSFETSLLISLVLAGCFSVDLGGVRNW